MDSDELDIGAGPDVSPDVVADVMRLLRDKDLPAIVAPLGGMPRWRVEALVAAGTPLAQAHGTWNEGALAAIDGLPPFARQSADVLTPSEMVRVVCECVHAPSGGMSSYYGFRGRFVSLLVSVPARVIWDARSEEAT